MINGINHHIISNPEYNKALAEEVTRALKSGSIVMGCDSGILPILLRGKKFMMISEKIKPEYSGQTYILEKI